MKGISVLFIFLSGVTFSQQRIGFDLSTRLMNINLTVHYQGVIRGPVLYSGGLFYGNIGRGYFVGDKLQLQSGFAVQSPYGDGNSTVVDSTGSYSLIEYTQSGRAGGIQFGLGYFHEFDVQHGLRINANTRLGYTRQKTTGYYWNVATDLIRPRTFEKAHFFGGITFEAYHTIRATGRITFFYGVKAPYYFSLDKATYNPNYASDVFYRFEPELSLGFTRVIGKCE